MNKLDTIKSAWLESMTVLSQSHWMKRLSQSDLNINHYKGLLRETYFQAGQNPQLQAYATAYFPQEKRNLIKRFYQHAISEISHDLLALNDLKALGVSEQKIINSTPLPETIAL